jgi:hypothetical protein
VVRVPKAAESNPKKLHQPGFLFQFCDIKNLVKFSKTLENYSSLH